MQLRNGAKLTAINCTFKRANIWLNGLTDNLFIGWWADIFVNDTNGFVPGALVTSYNNTDVKEFSGLSGDDGHVILPVIQEMLYRMGTIQSIDMNPHNITAYLYPDIANVTPKPIVSDNSNFTITFPGNTFPTPPQKLSTISQSDEINLTWEYPALVDLQRFEIFRSLDPEVFNFNNPIGTAGKFDRSWEDTDTASDWKTYYYCIRANDTIGQLGNASNIDRNGDWVVAPGINQQYSNLNVELNGSLLIESGGKLNLSNAKIQINNTKTIEFGVKVQSGGILKVIDNDNDPDTFADASNITTKNESLPIYFIVESLGKLFMNNSIVFGNGISNLEEANMGLYIGGSDSIIRNNTFIATPRSYHGIILQDVINVKILGNNFGPGFRTPVYILNTKDSFIENNTILDAVSYGIYSSLGCNNNYYANNIIMNTNYGIYLREGSFDKFEYNIFDNNNYGLYIRNSQNLRIFNNTFQNETDGYGIYFYDSPQSKVVDNKASDLRIGFYISRSSDLLISSNQVTNCTNYGFRIYDIPNSLLINNMVTNIDEIGISLEGSGYDEEEGNDVLIVGGNVTECIYGFYIEYGQLFRFEQINCWNNLYGFYSEYSSFIHINSSTFKDNFGIGVHGDGTGWMEDDSQAPYNTLLENCTLDNPYGMELGVENGAIIWIVNISIPYNRINFKDGESMVAFFWYTHIYAEDMFGSPAANSMIKIQKVGGEFTTKSTNNNGYLYWQLVHDITNLRDGNFTSNPYTITATQGNHSGENITIIKGPKIVKVKLDNSAPNVVDLSITPQMPYTTDDLVVTFGYSDPEGDPEFPRMIKWYADGVLKSNLANMTTINNTNTSKGQIWFARTWVYDGAAYSDLTDTGWVTIQNTKPTVSNVKITPNSPSSSTDIVVSYSFSDVDSDSEGDSRIKWFRNGDEAGFSGNTLVSTNTMKGEVWKAEVQPHDGDDYGTWEGSNEITIGNTPPSASNAHILPVNPMSNQTLNVSYVYYDLDSDLEGESTIKWFRNDIEQPDLNGSKTVPPSNTKKGEKWKYLMIPSDGTDFGDPLESNPVTIGNTEPQVENIKILPENPTTADDLTVQYEFLDDDGDTESYETSVQWLRKREGDIDFAYTGLQVGTLSSIYTVKNEIWTCEVTPHDNIAYGKAIRAEVSVTILNSAPIAKDTLIIPSEPTTKDELKANYVFSDMDNDLASGSEIKWFQNGAEITELTNKFTISSENTAKGQIWYFIIRPKDGQDYGPSIKSTNITIQNSPPMAKDVKVLPNSPNGNDNLSASYIYYDEDGDDESAPEIIWFENGIHQPEFDNQLTIDSEAVEKGENWHFEIRVFDGIDYSEGNSSNHPKIKNIIATAKSITPEAITAKTVLINETESKSFQINAEDPDGDLILYYWRLDGQLVSQDYFYTFTTNYEGEYSAGRYNLSLEFREFTETELTIIGWEIVVLNVNRPPVISSWAPVSKHSNLLEDKSLTFSVSATDPDKDDTLNFIWYFDDTPVPGQKGSSYAYTGSESDIGVHKIKVEAQDTTGAKDDYFWNITVKQKDEGERLYGQTYDWWGLVGTLITSMIGAGLFLFGFFRMRRKKSKLKEYLDQIEDIIESEKNPHEKEVQLKKLKGQIRKEFSQELIVENHYLILVQHVDNAIGEIRTSLLEEREAMPEELRGDVEEVLGDGVVTRTEYRAIAEKIGSSSDLSNKEKRRLNKLMKQWMKETETDSLEDELDEEITEVEEEPEISKVDEMIDEDIQDEP
jgi:parallel beta-helix repeat protein